MSDFLKAVEAAKDEAPRGLDMQRAEELGAQLYALQRDKKVSFVDSNEMSLIVCELEDHLFHGRPPLKFLEDLLDYYKAVEHRLDKTELPDLLKAAGVKAIRLANGMTLEVKERVSADLVDEAKFQAWAEAHGYADLLKVKFQFRKGEPIEAVRAALAATGANYTEGLDKSGLWQSLGKMARERMEQDLPLPPADALDVKVFDEVVIK